MLQGPAEPSHADIARRAYEIFVATGREQGQCQQNWRQAERELRKRVVAANSFNFSETLPAVRAGSGSAPQTFADDLHLSKGRRSSNRGGATLAPQGGSNTKT